MPLLISHLVGYRIYNIFLLLKVTYYIILHTCKFCLLYLKCKIYAEGSQVLLRKSFIKFPALQRTCTVLELPGSS